MARRKAAEDLPDGGWIAPGPGENRTSEEFMAGQRDQTQAEYDASHSPSKSWAKMFARRIAAIGEERSDGD